MRELHAMTARRIAALAFGLSACTDPADPSVVTCGMGATLEGDQCVATPITCGPGTHDIAGECVADPTPYQLRVATPLVADGVTPFEVRAFSAQVGVQVVLTTDRPGAGTFDPPSLTLDEIGGSALFTPCASTTPGCTGPVEVRMALAADLATPVARVSTALIAPPAIGSIAHCPPGMNTLYLDGTGYLYDGELTVNDGTATVTGGDRRAVIEIRPQHQYQGVRWTVDMSTVQLGMPLAVGVYTMAYNPYSTQPGRAGFQVLGDLAQPNCVPISDFQVHEAVFAANRWDRLTVSFRQYCQATLPAISGCARYERQP